MSRPAARTQGLAGAATMIAAITVVSRVLGLARWLVAARTVGAKAIGDAYTAANTVPNVLFEAAAGGALAGAVIPVLAGPVARRARAEVSAAVAGAVGWTLAALVPLGVLMAVAAGPVATLLGASSGPQREMVRFFVLVFAVQVPLYGLTVLSYAVLQAHHRFFWPAFAPILSSLVTIGAYLAYGHLAAGELVDPAALPSAALPVLAWGTTAGVAAMCLPALVATVRLGVVVAPRLRFPAGLGGQFRALALAGVAAVAAQQASVLVTLVLARHARSTGTWVVYSYAQQVYLLPSAVLVVPLATSAFPRLSAWAAAGDRDRFARLAAGSLAAVLLAAGAGAAVLVAVAPAVAMLFGAIRPEQADIVVPAMTVALTLMVPGLVGFAAMFTGSRTLYALAHGRDAVAVNAVGWGTVAVAGVLGFVLVGPGGDVIGALAAASTVGMTVGGVAVVLALRRAAGPSAVAGLARTVLVLVLGAGVAALVGRWVVGSVLVLLGPGPGQALLAGAGGGLVALAVVVAAVAVGDRRAAAGLLRLGREHGPV